MMSELVEGEFMSEHFELHPVAEAVYAAIAIEGGAASSNAGIIDLGEETLIFDTFETPKAAVDLKKAAVQLLGDQSITVVISHAHDDHWLGNQVFADHANILTTHEIRKAMIESAEELQEMQNDPSELVDLIQENQELLASEADEAKRTALKASIARLRHNLEMLPTLELRFPNLTFNESFVFHGTKRQAELRSKGAGHTSNDCYIVLPDDKAMFMGDLGFFDSQPFTVYSEPKAWIAQLEEMERMDIETFVPGHGPPGEKADIELQRGYISLVEQVVMQLINEGGTVEDAIQISLPEPFAVWQASGMTRFEANVRATYLRLEGK